jgi:uncharacterized membrane protein
MATLPLIPDWQRLHPLIVHFPTALLLVAPIFILIGILRSPKSALPFLLSGLILMALGTIASYVALSTGLAAGSLSRLPLEINAILKHHQSLAETTALTFSALTMVFAAIVIVPPLLSRQSSRVITAALPAVFLVLYAAGVVLLVDTAHMGGRLVHEFGITATHPTSSGGQVALRGR